MTISGSAGANVGSAAQLVVVVVNRGGSADSAEARITLSGLTVGAARTERGPGCSAAGSTLTCPLDFFPAGLTSSIVVTATISSLPASAQVSVTASPPDGDLSDNSAGWSTGTVSAAPATGSTAPVVHHPAKKKGVKAKKHKKPVVRACIHTKAKKAVKKCAHQAPKKGTTVKRSSSAPRR